MKLLNRIEWSLFLGSLVFFVVCSGVLWYTDRYVADLDGDTAYSYPIEGQDSPGFVSLATRLEAGQGFVSESGQPETFRTPAFPALIALSDMLGFGLGGVVLLQALLGALIVVLTYRIAVPIGGPYVGAVAAILTALSPNLFFHSAIILSDVLFTALFLSAVYLMFFRKVSMSVVFASGLLLGVATLVRPIAMFLPVVFVLGYVWQARSQEGYQSIAKLAGVFVLAFVLVVTPWIIRNGFETGVWAVSTVSSYNVAHYNVLSFLVLHYGTDSAEVQNFNTAIVAPPGADAYSAAESVRVAAAASGVIKQHFIQYATFHITEMSKFFLSSSVRYVALHVQVPVLTSFVGLNTDSPDLLHAMKSGNLSLVAKTLVSQWVLTLDRLLMLALSFLVGVALVVGKNKFYVVFLVVLIAYFAILTGPVSIPRYRLPVEPLMYILAIYAVHTLWQWRYTARE